MDTIEPNGFLQNLRLSWKVSTPVYLGYRSGLLEIAENDYEGAQCEQDERKKQ